MERIGLWKRAGITLVVCAAAVAAPAQTLTLLHSFSGPDGNQPSGLIQASDGYFYGTTSYGGAYGNGTVFKITAAGTLTTLYNFCAKTGCNDGALAAGLMQATDGNFYGTTNFGGAYPNCANYGNGCGTVFQITPAGTLTTLYSFCAQTGCPDGFQPNRGLMQATDGNFYGTTNHGGASSNCQGGCGTIFKITSGGTLTTLYSFCAVSGCPDGNYPVAGLIQGTDGNFYGTTDSGGAYGNGDFGGGTVFRITPGGTLTTLYRFCAQGYCPDGSSPHAELMQAADGNFYGTAGGGAYYCGTVFKVTPAGTLTTLNSLDVDKDGCGSQAGLVQAADGNFYGTTFGGGAYSHGTWIYGHGTVFEVTAGGTLTSLYSFCTQTGCPDGARPTAGLIQATDGNFYGTTSCDYPYNCPNASGTVFRLAAAPAVKLTPTLSFGAQALDDTSAAHTVTLKNSGTALLNVIGITINGSFAISANACGGTTLGIGKTCKVSLTFTPAVLGKLTGTLTFTDNASNSPQRVAVSGTGFEPATLMPPIASLGTWAVGTTSTAKTFTLTNYQSETLNSIAISTTGDFAVLATTCTTSLAAKSKCMINVNSTPTALGKRTGMLSVSDSARNSPQTSTLAGWGALPATLTPATTTYASQTVGTTSPAHTFTLTNNQNVTLNSIAISTTGDFAVSATTCTTSLPAKGTCTISVTFTPTATGMRKGKLTVSDSASNSPQTSNLAGTGD